MTARLILTDIEGTLGSVSFVKDVLFPYARDRLPAFVADHRAAPKVAALLDEARILAELPDDTPDDRIVAALIGWLDEDRKAPPLKTLQGLIWRGGYETGVLKAHVYADAVDALRAWAADGVPLYVYSSGSVDAQDLYFGHTEAGDLRPLFRGYFDTRTGAKSETASYTTIAATVGVAAADILFLSDAEAELVAARAAGMQVVGLARPGAAPLRDANLPVVTSFADIAVPVSQ